MAVKLALSLVVMSDSIVICLFVVFYAVSRGFPRTKHPLFNVPHNDLFYLMFRKLPTSTPFFTQVWKPAK